MKYLVILAVIIGVIIVFVSMIGSVQTGSFSEIESSIRHHLNGLYLLGNGLAIALLFTISGIVYNYASHSKLQKEVNLLKSEVDILKNLKNQ